MENIIKVLNKFVRENYTITGKFVQHKSHVVNPNFKTLKTYTLCMYYVNKGKTYPIIEETITVKETEGNLAEKEINTRFLIAIFDYVASDEFRDLVNGRINI